MSLLLLLQTADGASCGPLSPVTWLLLVHVQAAAVLPQQAAHTDQGEPEGQLSDGDADWKQPRRGRQRRLRLV